MRAADSYINRADTDTEQIKDGSDVLVFGDAIPASCATWI